MINHVCGHFENKNKNNKQVVLAALNICEEAESW
jgi:hypothetical protein